MRKLVILLTDPLKVYYQKGEIKEGYYNPEDFFDEIHMVSFCDNDIDVEKVRVVGGNANLFIHTVGRLNLFTFIKSLRRVYILIKNIRPDVIRAYDPSLRGAMAAWFGKRFKIPSIISIHSELDVQRRLDKRMVLRLRKIFENYSIRNADCIICVTNYVGEYARRHKARRIEILYNEVPLDKFCKQGVDKIFKRRTILSVARLEKPKRQDCLIKAMRDIDMDLVLVGDGNLKDKLKKLAKDIGVIDRVFFIGAVPHKDIYKYYVSCDIFAIATDFEGFCIPVIEAMAVGIPIVASDIPPIREILGDAGILAENKPDLFRNAFVNLQKNQDLYKNLSDSGKKRAAKFDSKVIEEEEKRLYQSLKTNR